MDVLEQGAGVALITAGTWLIAPPIAIILLGIILGVHGALAELKRIREKEADGNRELAPSDNSARNT